jgi:hypothetical protein
MPWCHSHVNPFHFCVTLNAYTTCTWKTMHLMKLRHSNLPHYLELTLTSRHVGLMPTTYFPSGPRPCCSKLLTFVFRPNYKLRLVQGLNALWPMPWAPFFKPSLVGTYATRKCVTPRVEPNPTLILITQAATRGTPWWFELGP